VEVSSELADTLIAQAEEFISVGRSHLQSNAGEGVGGP